MGQVGGRNTLAGRGKGEIQKGVDETAFCGVGKKKGTRRKKGSGYWVKTRVWGGITPEAPQEREETARLKAPLDQVGKHWSEVKKNKKTVC